LIHTAALHFTEKVEKHKSLLVIVLTLVFVTWLLTSLWMPLGVSVSHFTNFLFISLLLGLVLGGFAAFIRIYPRLLMWCLANKGTFLIFPVVVILMGVSVWQGFDKVFGIVPRAFD